MSPYSIVNLILGAVLLTSVLQPSKFVIFVHLDEHILYGHRRDYHLLDENIPSEEHWNQLNLFTGGRRRPSPIRLNKIGSGERLAKFQFQASKTSKLTSVRSSRPSLRPQTSSQHWWTILQFWLVDWNQLLACIKNWSAMHGSCNISLT